ncbi:MAG TPA: FGGY-family carbohydrate kinase [Candidatus Anammoximicrobium sp.]|nr:FGGY-family carbohydrate kinase [Candidatus Anammoximicrobium sp.]
MAGQFLLGIDNGGTVAKAALFSPDGREVAVAANKTETLSPAPGWSEFDMNALWSAAAAAVREVIAKARVDSQQIVGVACTGHGNGIYLVDAALKPVRNAIFSADARARSYVERWTAAGIGQAVRAKTMQSLWPGQPNALLAWLRDHEPDAYARTRWVLMCKDFVRARLTGQAAGELTDMSGTSLMDVGTAQYDPDILDRFGIGDAFDKLPPLRRSAEICGEVTPAAAAETGLAPGTPVAGGLFDVDACALASALLSDRELGMVLGTWGINEYASRTPVTSDDVFMTSRYCLPDQFLMIEASPTSAGNLEWVMGHLLRNFAGGTGQQGSYDYAQVNRLVAETSLGDSPVIFLPFLYGSNSHPDATGTLVGLSSRCDRRHVLRAVYEGVVFAHQTHLERLLKFRDQPHCIRASGGATRSDVWMQILADALQIPVEIPDGSELGALGAAICAAVAVGVHPDYPAACAAMVRIARSFAPDSRRAEAYRAKYDRYRRLLAALHPAWQDLRA